MRFSSFLSTTSKEKHFRRHSEIYTKHTTHEPCIHTKNHRRRRWDGCPFGARPPAPRRHHAPRTYHDRTTARPGRPGTTGAPDNSQTRGAIKSTTPPSLFSDRPHTTLHRKTNSAPKTAERRHATHKTLPKATYFDDFSPAIVKLC